MRTLAALALLAAAAPTAGADDATAAKQLDGAYEVLEVLTGGKPDKKKDEVKSFVIKGGEIVIATGQKGEAVKFAVDPSKKPAHIDITGAKGESLPGIYELKETDKGTELTVALSRADRPKDFKGEGPDDVVMKLFRKKAK